MSNAPLPPKTEWPKLTLPQLYDVKSKMMDIYYNARQAGATYAPQFLKLVEDVDIEISTNMSKAAQEAQLIQDEINQN